MKILFQGFVSNIHGSEQVIVDGIPEKGYWVVSDCIMQFDGGRILKLWDTKNGWVPVILKTFGLYTGIIDAKGAKVFEGDILRHTKTHEIRTVQWHGSFAQFVMSEVRKSNKATREWIDMYFANQSMGQWEKIGNVHTNPDLLNQP